MDKKITVDHLQPLNEPVIKKKLAYYQQPWWKGKTHVMDLPSVPLNIENRVLWITNGFSMARDLKEIVTFGYKIKKIKPVDMFPHTPHIESVVTLVNECR